jgi:hypothetical protein
MGWLMKFPKCRKHVAAEWEPQTFKRGTDKRWYRYAAARCAHCARPLVAFHSAFPEEERLDTRRHVAWHYLDKEGEHAGNVAVLPWGSETFSDVMSRTVNAQ